MEEEPLHCYNCQYFRGMINHDLAATRIEGPVRWHCDVFRAGIPSAIVEERHDHRTPYPGDNGVVYKRKV